MNDLVIRGGKIADGTGQDTFTADIAVRDGKITEVGQVEGEAAREINADGRLVTPGFVDIHTHYDAQATWDPHLLPSGWHGVTTAVVGNCGVGFAPAKRDQHQMHADNHVFADHPYRGLSDRVKYQESDPPPGDRMAHHLRNKKTYVLQRR